MSDTKPTLGLIGLGDMGSPMGRNLIANSYPLVVHDINPRAMQSLLDLGARGAWSAAEVANLARARALNDRMFPIAHAFYADPFVDMHNRMKEALVILGRIPCAAVRPPLVKLKEAEIRRIEQALEQAGVRGHGAMERAA